MAFTTGIDTTKANVEAKITALTGSETIDDLLILNVAAQGLNTSNYGVLETAMELLINTQTPSTETVDIMLASKILGQTQVRTNTITIEQVVDETNANYPVPANAIACLVTCGAGGGGGSTVAFADAQTLSYSGGGSGAYVTDFPIGVDAGGTLNVQLGAGTSSGANTGGTGQGHTIGDLVVSGGEGGTNTAWATSRAEGGAGGEVRLGGILQPDGATVKNGVAGGYGAYQSATTSGDGDDQYGYLGGAGASYGGGGGAAGWGGAGGAGGFDNHFSQTSTGGDGAAGAGGGGQSSQRDASQTNGKGGAPTTNITLKFIIETVV